MATIPEEEISFGDISRVDPAGRVFFWQGNVYRGIYPSAAATIRTLFTSGCIDELVQLELFPRSRISEHQLKGFAFVVEHERISTIIYPHEWSFDMLRDAALVILKVVQTAESFGWDVQDCGSYNIVFRNSRPMYVDLGGFRLKPQRKLFDKGPDLVRIFWRPLFIWASGDSFLAQRILSSAHMTMPDLSWWHYRHPHWNYLGRRANYRLLKWTSRVWRRLSSFVTEGNLLARLSPEFAGRWLPMELVWRRPEMIRRKLNQLKRPSSGPWEEYPFEYVHAEEVSSTPRLDRIIEIVQSLPCESATELAGGQGRLALLLARKTGLKKVICTDYSHSAINQFYNHCRHARDLKGRELEAAVLNFMLPETAALLPPPHVRFKADLVIALAVTHHLLLTQKFSVENILGTIAGYTRRYVIMEFMPLGLWDGKRTPSVPNWYNLEWFQEAFTKVFDLKQVEKLEANRIVLVGELKKQEPVKTVALGPVKSRRRGGVKRAP